MQRTIHRCLRELRQHRKDQGTILADLPDSPFLDEDSDDENADPAPNACDAQPPGQTITDRQESAATPIPQQNDSSENEPTETHTAAPGTPSAACDPVTVFDPPENQNDRNCQKRTQFPPASTPGLRT
jgi:hypothetical protein